MKGYPSYYSTSLTEMTQDESSYTIDVSDSFQSVLDTGKERLLAFNNWQLQFTVSGETTSGEVSVGLKIPGADDFSTFTTTISLASTNLLLTFTGLAEELKITPVNFDGTSFSVFCVAS